MIYLASKSPRRRQLLEQLGIDHEVLDVEIEEIWDGNERVKNYVTRLALEKGRAGKTAATKDLPVLAADTEVCLDGMIMGKPETRDDALRMLAALSGRTHQVYSAVALIHTSEQVRINISRVYFRQLTFEECRAYCDSGEPFGKAGAYAIQGQAAGFIERLEGSYSGVMGLPLFETAELLSAHIKTARS